MAVNNNEIGLSIPQGYDYEFVDKLPDDCICKICHLALRKPVQTKCCGHRFCKECLDEANRSKAQPVCPMDRKNLNLEVDLFPDKAAERWISSFLIKCPSKGCEWQGELGNIEPHEQKCDYKIIKCSNVLCDIMKPRMKMTNHLEEECGWRDVLCPHCKKTCRFWELETHLLGCLAFPVSCPNQCGKVIKREQVEDHVSNICPLAIVPCIYQEFGCEFETRRKCIDEHLDSGVKEHLNITSGRLISLKNENATLKKELNDVKKQSTALNADLETLKKEKKELENEVKNLKNNMNQRFNNLNRSINAVRNVKNVLQKQVGELKQKLKSTKTTKLVWRIEDFLESLKKEKENNENNALTSDPFYTEKHGYKLQVSLYPNGEGKGKNTHVSVFLAVLKGEYDAILPWPFKGKIKFTLVDQKEELDKRKNIQNSFSTENNEHFNRPETTSNLAWGYATFLSHELLKSEKYVVDNTIFLQVEVEMQ